MAPEQDFENFFNEDAGPAQADDFGQMPGEDAPVVAVVVEGEGAGDKSGEDAANAQAAAEAQAVNQQDNAGADDEAGSESTATVEAARQAGAVDDATEIAAEGVQPLESTPDLDDLSDVPPEDTQRAKSWIGRLKKIEADLMAQKAAFEQAGKTDADAGDTPAGAPENPMGEALEQAADKADAAGDSQMADAISNQAEAVESGQTSFQTAMASLAADFGDEFVQFIQAVAQEAAGRGIDEKLGPVSKNVGDVIQHLQNEGARNHFETIHGAHPDFADITDSPDFKAFEASYPDGQRIVESGSAREINAMLAAFKAQKATGNEPPAPEIPEAAAQPAAASGPSDDEIDAAGGVRSQGLRLPQQPGRASDDYESAWNSF